MDWVSQTKTKMIACKLRIIYKHQKWNRDFSTKDDQDSYLNLCLTNSFKTEINNNSVVCSLCDESENTAKIYVQDEVNE